MKKISFILALVMLISVVSVFPMSATAEYPSAEGTFNGYENLCLTYTYNGRDANFGRHMPEDFKPYVAYYDTDGNIKDFFFDSYLFLPCMTYGVSGARLHYDSTNPTKAVDWEAYVYDTFYKGTNVDALEIAFGEAKQKLNSPDKKAGVVLSILYPGFGQTDFGTLGGKQLNFNNFDDRKYAIKWIIDEQLSRFNSADYKHLELIGFYWLEEYLVTYGNKEQNIKLYQYASEYLHSLGLKFVWIPYYKANGYEQWKNLGFDIACMQPNMFWEQIPTPNRVVDSCEESKRIGMGMEIELDYRAISSSEYYNRYLDYLAGGLKTGAMNSVKMYYQDAKSGIYYQAWKSKDPRVRSIYDLTYKYAKKTLTLEELEKHMPEVFTLPENVNWRSKGKKYVATQAYIDGNGSEYQNISGKELTDGVIGASELGTEWHGFHKSRLDPDGRMSVTVDLGAIYKDLTHFVAHFSHVQNYGVSDPADLKIEISTDGETFTTIATPELQTRDISAYYIHSCKPVAAQYIKFSFTNSKSNFVFCSEVMVGAGKYPSETESKPESIEPNDPIESIESNGEESVSEPEDNVTDSNATLFWVIIGALVIVIIGAAVAIFIKKKTKKN